MPKSSELTVACPTCGAGATERCRSARTGKPVNTHAARLHLSVHVLTPDELEERRHRAAMHAAQYDPNTLVQVSFGFSCGCSQEPSDPLPLREANTAGVGRTWICDHHDEFAVITRVTTRLVADEATLQRILLAGDVDPDSAAYVAGNQSDAARHRRLLARHHR